MLKYLLVGTLLIPGIAQAEFALNAIRSIHCTDLAITANSEIYLSTDSEAAKKYTRRIDTIPYDYGNKKPQLPGFQTGQMTLQNHPDTENGVIALADLWDETNIHSLRLEPTSQMGIYQGALSGHIDIEGDWTKIVNHPVRCQVRFE